MAFTAVRDQTWLARYIPTFQSSSLPLPHSIQPNNTPNGDGIVPLAPKNWEEFELVRYSHLNMDSCANDKLRRDEIYTAC